MRTRHRVAVVCILTAAPGWVACLGETCRPNFDYFSAWGTAGRVPDAAQGVPCSLAVTAGDASLVIDIAGVDGDTGLVPCTAASLPPDTFFCLWSGTNLSVDTVDVDAAERVLSALGNPSPATPVPATLTCNGKVVPGVATSAYLQTCAE